MRYLHVIHAIPGRTRLRYPALRHLTGECERVADALAAMDGVTEVHVRPYTGSILVLHDASVSVPALVEAIQRVLDVDHVLKRSESPPPVAVPELSRIARLAARTFRQLDRDMLAASEGSFDLGTLVTMSFLGLGGMQIASARELVLPPWFQLAWWSYRTFMTNEQDEIAHEVRRSDGA
jgi:hypothetical protein